jgi:predicted transcriptional regulator
VLYISYRWLKLLSLQKLRIMLTKEKLNKTINNLPDSFTIDELIDQLIFIEKIEEGYQQSEEGKVISNEDVKSMIDKWSK